MHWNFLLFHVSASFNWCQPSWDSTLRPPTPDMNSKATTPMAQTLERKSNTQDTATEVPCFHCLGAYFQCTKSKKVQRPASNYWIILFKWQSASTICMQLLNWPQLAYHFHQDMDAKVTCLKLWASLRLTLSRVGCPRLLVPCTWTWYFPTNKTG